MNTNCVQVCDTQAEMAGAHGEDKQGTFSQIIIIIILLLLLLFISLI